jgi:hypothetical protein
MIRDDGSLVRKVVTLLSTTKHIPPFSPPRSPTVSCPGSSVVTAHPTALPSPVSIRRLHLRRLSGVQVLAGLLQVPGLQLAEVPVRAQDVFALQPTKPFTRHPRSLNGHGDGSRLSPRGSVMRAIGFSLRQSQPSQTSYLRPSPLTPAARGLWAPPPSYICCGTECFCSAPGLAVSLRPAAADRNVRRLILMRPLTITSSNEFVWCGGCVLASQLQVVQGHRRQEQAQQCARDHEEAEGRQAVVNPPRMR